MKKWNLSLERKRMIILGGIIFLITILDFINGSTFRILEMTGPECLATHLFQISILILVASLFLKMTIKKKIQKWILALIVPTVLAMS
ncbi:MAG: hypothetical protein AAF599_05215, partial [Bacteroidota bacterium]